MANPWILAARPKTLPAALVPVLLGTAEAARIGEFRLVSAILCAAFALLIQIGTNFANDYYDFLKGADTEKRKGPTRAVAAGLIAPKTMRHATIAIFALAFVIGMGLIPFGGWWLIIIGILCIACGIAYTGGPFPIAYNGLGELFVMLFFGIVAVCMTYYVQAGHFSYESLYLALGCGALSTNLLVVNNVRDIDTDRQAGKITLAARFGKRFGIYEYQGFLMVAWMAFIAIYMRTGEVYMLLPCLLYPLGRIAITKLIRANSAAEYNTTLGLTAVLLISYGALGSVALLVGPVIAK